MSPSQANFVTGEGNLVARDENSGSENAGVKGVVDVGASHTATMHGSPDDEKWGRIFIVRAVQWRIGTRWDSAPLIAEPSKLEGKPLILRSNFAA
ncbi:hypothetical protein ACG7TL_006147 [Trametes sanguinea]